MENLHKPVSDTTLVAAPWFVDCGIIRVAVEVITHYRMAKDIADIMKQPSPLPMSIHVVPRPITD